MSTPHTPEPGTPDAAPARPLLRIVRGDPTPEELAAVVAVLAARGGGASDDGPAPTRSRWASYEAGLRKPLHPAPDAWRAWH